MTLRHPLLALLLSTSITLTGCPGLISALPAVTSAIVEVANVVDTIAAWVELYFRQRPASRVPRDEPGGTSPATGLDQATVMASIAKVRNAMNIVLRLAESAKHADDREVAKAFDDLEAAYRELLELTRPLGVRPEGLASGRVAAAPDSPVLTVPATLRRPR